MVDVPGCLTSKDISDDTQKIRVEIAKNQERIDYAEKMMLDRQMDKAGKIGFIL